MSGLSTYDLYDSDEENSAWLLSSKTSVDDGLSDELTLLNGDEDSNDGSLAFVSITLI